MSRRPPWTDPLKVELQQEAAGNLGRLGDRLEEALQALAEREADARSRRALLIDAADALFDYVVQREATGFRNTTLALDLMGVPREVRLRMAPRSVLERRL